MCPAASLKIVSGPVYWKYIVIPIGLFRKVNYMYTSPHLQLLATVRQMAPVSLVEVSRLSTRPQGTCKKFDLGMRLLLAQLLFEGSGGYLLFQRQHLGYIQVNICNFLLFLDCHNVCIVCRCNNLALILLKYHICTPMQYTVSSPFFTLTWGKSGEGCLLIVSIWLVHMPPPSFPCNL